MWMTECKDLNIHNNRDLSDYSMKPANPNHHHHQNLNIHNNRDLSDYSMKPANPNHHHHQMARVTSSQPSRSSRGVYYVDKQPAAAAPSRSSRWNPTPEQLMALEEMYRSGLKTPTAQQIRLVTAQLRNYGRIEGKNVFYWFQNHRARERQKRRRQLMSMYQSDHSKQPKQSAGGLPKSSVEVEQQIKWKLPNCSVLSDQESSSVLQERMMSMSMQLVKQSDSSRPTSDTKLSCTKFLDFHHYYDYDCGMVLSAPSIYKEEEEESREIQTLELFPLKSDNVKDAKETKLVISRTTSTDATANLMADNIIDQFLGTN